MTHSEGQPDLFGQPTHEVVVRSHFRTVAGEAPPDGAERKESGMAQAVGGKTDVQAAIEYARTELRYLYQRRFYKWGDSAAVHADDLHRILLESPHHSRTAKEGSQAWRGSVWRKGFAWTGKMVESDAKVRPSQHCAMLKCWRAI